MAQREFTQHYPQPGWVEHDPLEIWSTQLGVLVEAAGGIGVDLSDVAAIGITNQRETTIVWDKETGGLFTMRSCGSAVEQRTGSRS